MQDSETAREDLQHIRAIMHRTSRFVSFSGFSAIGIGLLWLVALAFYGPGLDDALRQAPAGTIAYLGSLRVAFGGLLGLFLLSLAIGLGVTYREAIRNGESMRSSASLRVAFAMTVHLAVGACLGYAVQQFSHLLAYGMVPVLYGLMLLNLSRYARHDVQPLGMACIAAGLWACFTGQVWLGLLLAFGAAHIGYGAWMELAKRIR